MLPPSTEKALEMYYWWETSNHTLLPRDGGVLEQKASELAELRLVITKMSFARKIFELNDRGQESVKDFESLLKAASEVITPSR